MGVGRGTRRFCGGGVCLGVGDSGFGPVTRAGPEGEVRESAAVGSTREPGWDGRAGGEGDGASGGGSGCAAGLAPRSAFAAAAGGDGLGGGAGGSGGGHGAGGGGAGRRNGGVGGGGGGGSSSVLVSARRGCFGRVGGGSGRGHFLLAGARGSGPVPSLAGGRSQVSFTGAPLSGLGRGQKKKLARERAAQTSLHAARDEAGSRVYQLAAKAGGATPGERPRQRGSVLAKEVVVAGAAATAVVIVGGAGTPVAPAAVVSEGLTAMGPRHARNAKSRVKKKRPVREKGFAPFLLCYSPEQ